jgi:predicted metal-dependent phosphoesterase TrpH
MIKSLEVLVIYDLHSHSNISDGSLSPEDLVVRASAKGVTHLALTDHDTVGGLQRAEVAAHEMGMHLIQGIEFSTQWLGCGIHVVGLNIDSQNTALQSAICSQVQTRIDRAIEIGQRLSVLGIDDAYEEACKISEGVVGRPHFAQYLVSLGLVPTVNAAFKKYLGTGKVGDVPQRWIEMPRVIDAIVQAGGVAVLAHPGKYRFTRTKLKKLIHFFVESGGQAIEVVSGKQLATETNYFADLAEQFNMHSSCGSDFHTPDQPWQDLGGFTQLPDRCQPVWRIWS